MENAESSQLRRRLLNALFAVLAVGALKRTFQDSQLNSEDFHVYWKAAHAWLTGANPYAFTAADQGFVFKYPPWILPLFLPIGVLPFEVGKLVWFGVGVACVAYTILWCIRQGVPTRIAAFTACLFWWMFHAHFSAGQFTMVLLVTALWAFGPAKPETKNSSFGIRTAILAYVLSAKVFSLLTLTGIWQRFKRPAPWLAGIALFVLTHAVVLAVNSMTGATLSLAEIYRDFAIAASSGGAELGAIIVRGQGNHGFTALALRTLQINSLSFSSDMLTSLVLFIPLSIAWARHSKVLTDAERWAGWIALALIVHPLAWHHSFVLAYPLCALSIARAARTEECAGRKKILPIAVLGACCIGIFIPQVLGHTLVKPIELAGVKSWGVVLAAIALVWAATVQTIASPKAGPS